MAGISYIVPLVAQVGSNTCWYACAQMLVAWRRGTTGNEGRPLLDNPTDEAVHKINNPLNTADFDRFFGRLGMRLEHFPLSRDNIVQLLRSGPLIYSGRLNGYRGNFGRIGHAVVITGAEINNASATVGINDPQPMKLGSRLVISVDELTRGLPFTFPIVHF